MSNVFNIDRYKIYIFILYNIIFSFFMYHTANMQWGGTFHRSEKLGLSILIFSILFTIISDSIKRCILPLTIGALYFLSNGVVMYLYSISNGGSGVETHYELFFSCLLTVFLLSISTLISNRFFIITIIEMILFLVILLEIFYYFLFQCYFDSEAIFFILQTNVEEAILFIKEYIFLFTVLILSIMIIGFIINNINDKLSVNYRKKIISIFALILCLIISYKLILNDSQLNLYRNYLIAKGYIEQSKQISNINIAELKINNDVKNIVIVIGESACRDYMNVYGYERDNTPWMTSNKNNENWVFFDNVYSCNKATNKSLAYVLTQKSQYDSKDLYECINLIDILKASGFETYWISLQGNFDNSREVYNVIANKSDHKYFLEDSNRKDEDVVEFLNVNNEKNGKKKAIFIHLIGSHHPYKSYNKKFNKYPVNNINDNYDNTIYYTDYVIHQIYERVKNRLDLLIYFSDHGESKHMLRNKFDFRMERIPFVIYCSDGFIKNNCKIYNQMIQNKNTYFTTDMLYDTLLHILGIDENYYYKNQALFSDEYLFNKDNLKTEYGSINIKDDPYDK